MWFLKMRYSHTSIFYIILKPEAQSYMVQGQIWAIYIFLQVVTLERHCIQLFTHVNNTLHPFPALPMADFTPG